MASVGRRAPRRKGQRRASAGTVRRRCHHGPPEPPRPPLTASPPRHVALVGTTASGKSALALALARRDPDVEIVSVDSMQVYRGMDIGTAKPTAAERAEVPHHLSTWPTRGRTSPWRGSPARARRPCSPTSRPGATGRCSWAAPACTCGPSSTTSTSRGGTPRCGPSSRTSPTPSALHRRLDRARPGGRRAHGADQPAPGRAGAGGHARQRPAVLVVRARARRLPADAASACVGVGLPHDVVAAAHRRRATTGRWPTGFLDEVRRPAGRPARAVPHRPPGPRLPGAARPPRRRARRSTRRSSWPSGAPAASPAASGRGSGRDPRIRWLEAPDDPTRCSRRCSTSSPWRTRATCVGPRRRSGRLR